MNTCSICSEIKMRLPCGQPAFEYGFALLYCTMGVYGDAVNDRGLVAMTVAPACDANCTA